MEVNFQILKSVPTRGGHGGVKMKTQKKEKEAKNRPASRKPAHRKMPAPGKLSGPDGSAASGPRRLLSLRNKIFVSFLLPILFVVVIGIVSYNAAADEMN